MNRESSELVEWLEELIQRRWPDPIDALEAEYEIALARLARLVAGASADAVDKQTVALTERLARHFLFNYYTGFAIARFVSPLAPPSRRHKELTARQQAIEEALRRLAHLPPGRRVMVEWFSAALEGRLSQILRDWLSSARPSLHPSRAFYRSATTVVGLPVTGWLERLVRFVGFGEELEVLNFWGFGLSGFYLIFKETGRITDGEFAFFSHYLQTIATEHPWFLTPIMAGLLNVLVVPLLSPEQKTFLRNQILALDDMERFPNQPPYSELIRYLQNIVPGHSLFFASMIADLLFPEPPLYYSEIIRSIRGQYQRRWEIAAMLADLAQQDETCLRYWEETALSTRPGRATFLASYALESALPAIVLRPSSLDILGRYLERTGRDTLSESELNALQERLEIPLGKPAVAALLETVRRRGDRARWAAQILEHIPALQPATVAWLVEVLENEGDPRVVGILLRLYKNLVQAQERRQDADLPYQDLEAALHSRLLSLLLSPDEPLEAEWLRWMLETHTEGWVDFLRALQDCLHRGTPQQVARVQHVLERLARESPRLSTIEAERLAACWLADPQDPIQDGRPLPERLQAAIALSHARLDEVQHQIIRILAAAIPEPPARSLEPYLASAGKTCQAIARAFGTIHLPDAALPLLRRLFSIAVELGQAWESSRSEFGGFYRWPEFSQQAADLARDVLRSVANINPLTHEAVGLIAEMLAGCRATDALDRLTPAFVYEEILPRLAERDVCPDTVPLLLEQVWRCHCAAERLVPEILIGDAADPLWPPASLRRSCPDPQAQPLTRRMLLIHRYGHILREAYNPEGLTLLCALQALAKVTTLTPEQQRVIWWVYRTSWNAHIKALCLLILGRQRDADGAPYEEVIRELIRVLRRDPMREFWRMTVAHAIRLWVLRRLYISGNVESDINHIYLSQAVAARLVGDLLRLERERPVVRKHRDALQKALVGATSFWRWGMEPHLGRYASVGSGASHVRGMARLLAATEAETPALVRPADVAYQVLRELREMGAL